MLGMEIIFKNIPQHRPPLFSYAKINQTRVELILYLTQSLSAGSGSCGMIKNVGLLRYHRYRFAVFISIFDVSSFAN
jgi:hypothetical protein